MATYAAPDAAQGAPEGKTVKPEEEDFSETPFTEYAEFNETQEEEADTKFFQFGRFFGVSLGMGTQFVDGNRGSLWQGGFPVVDFRLHYWFDFNIGLDLGFHTAQHFFNTTVANQGHVDVNMLHVGVHIKYYFPTRNLSSAISFANPYVLVGAGTFSKNQNSAQAQLTDTDASVGVSAGAGFEFTVSPRKTYFELEGKIHIFTFKDTFSTIYSSTQGLANLTGNFYTVTGSLLFTW